MPGVLKLWIVTTTAVARTVFNTSMLIYRSAPKCFARGVCAKARFAVIYRCLVLLCCCSNVCDGAKLLCTI